MTRVSWLAVLAILAGAAGCGEEEAVQIAPRFERTCSEGGACPGRKCVRVGENAQNAAGLCSKACTSDVDCGVNAACFQLGDAGASCLSLCSETQPCEGGLACVPVGSAGETACFVEPILTTG